MATKKQAAGPATKGLKVQATVDSFWRAQRQFTREWVTIPLAELTPEQAAEIREEGDLTHGHLVVVEVDIEPAKAA